MNIYTINIIVNTKKDTSKLYDKVSINKFPIIITAESEEDIYTNTDLWTALKDMFIDESVYNTAEFYIRSIDESFNINEITKSLKEIKTFQDL